MSGPAERPLVAVVDLVTSVGGVQRVLAGLLPRLAPGLRVVAIDPHEHPGYAALLDEAGVARAHLGRPPRRRHVGGRGPLGRAARLAARAPWLAHTGWRLRTWMARERPAVVWFNQLAAARFFRRFVPRPGPALLYHAHGFGAAADVGDGAALGRDFDRVLAVSHATAGLLAEAGLDPRRVAVVHNGVDAAALRAQAAAAGPPLPARRPGATVVVQVAVLDPQKRQDLALRALAALPDGVELWLCGATPAGADPAYERGLRSLALDLGLGDRVHFLGWRPDVPRVVAAADVALLVSRSEGLPMALVEAMALGKPCVGTDVNGIHEVIEDGVTGLRVGADGAGLAAALGALAGSPVLRGALGQAGAARARALFDLEGQARRVRAELEALAAGPVRRPGAGAEAAPGAAP